MGGPELLLTPPPPAADFVRTPPTSLGLTISLSSGNYQLPMSVYLPRGFSAPAVHTWQTGVWGIKAPQEQPSPSDRLMGVAI